MTENYNQEKNLIEFIVCSNCDGRGFIQNAKCPVCGGLATVAHLNGKYLYWGKKIDRFNIMTDRTINVINKVINLLLMLFGLFGVFTVAYVAFQNQFMEILRLDYWRTPSWEKAIFWTAVLLSLYLYYRLAMESSPRKSVLLKLTKKNIINQSQDWQAIKRQPKRNLIDVSLAFDQSALRLVEEAWFLARSFNQAKLERVHFFATLPAFDSGALIFGRLGIRFDVFKEKIGRLMSWHLQQKGSTTDLAPEIYRLLIGAYFLAYRENKSKVEIEEIILSLVTKENYPPEVLSQDYVEKILIDLELNYQKVINVVEWSRLQQKMRTNLSRFRSRARYKPKSGLDRAMTGIATPYLDQFSEDLTKLARAGYLFPCIGREAEFEQIFRVFEGSRDGVLLLGNPGVGRTTIIEGLAQRMVEESVPEALQDKRLVRISLSQLISGVTPAMAQERFLLIINEVAQSQNIVVVVEDLHNAVGISGEGSNLDLSEVFAEVLKKNLFLVVATSTPGDYTSYIERRSLGEVFQPIKVKELELNDAIQVLEAKSGPIEYKNNVYFSYDSIEKAAVLSDKYLHDQYLPEKALTILENVAVKVSKEKGPRSVITAEDVAVLIAEQTGIQVRKVTESEADKLLNLEQNIHARVIGQDEAVKMVSASLRRSRAELRDEKRPISSMLFLGPTGVGKTELAKTVAEVYFGAEDTMLRFDMSEYQEQSSIGRLIGTPETNGILTEAVRQKPFSLVLFDEVEKAHRDILNLFLQVMDDGRLTDGRGNTIDFTNTIIIMTSNAGAQIIQDDIRAGVEMETIKQKLINEQLKAYFRPELLNRFDGIIVFTPLTMNEIIAIARLLAKKIIKKLEDKEIYLTISDAAIAELAEMGYDPQFGARPLRRVIQERVDDLLANALLTGKVTRRDKITLEPGGELKIEKAESI